MLDKVDRLLGKKTNIDQYIAGDTHRSSARPKFDVSDSIATFDLEASVAMSRRDGKAG